MRGRALRPLKGKHEGNALSSTEKMLTTPLSQPKVISFIPFPLDAGADARCYVRSAVGGPHERHSVLERLGIGVLAFVIERRHPRVSRLRFHSQLVNHAFSAGQQSVCLFIRDDQYIGAAFVFFASRRRFRSAL